MAFWGIEVKPGKPYTHSTSKDGSSSGRLRISQATLAIGTATLKSLVQCNVGDKRPVLLCALLPNKTESLQLDLEFDEAEDVMFSVIGPRGVYLTGYYVGHNRRLVLQDDSESFGEDIANSETMESNHNTDEDEYDDSFINDDEPEPLTPTSISSSGEDDNEEDITNKKTNGGHKRLKKRYQSIESDDEMSVPEIDDEDDFPISSVCKNNKSQGSGKKPQKEISAKVDKETKNNDNLDSKDKVVVDLVNDETTGKGDQPNTSMPSLAEVVTESKLKIKKKNRESSKEEKSTDVLDAQDHKKSNKETTAKVNKNNDDKYKSDAVNSRVLRSKHKADIDLVDGEIKENQPTMSVASLVEVVSESKSKKKKKKLESSKEQKGSDALAAKDEQKTKDMVADRFLEVLDSAEVVPEKNSKSKKRKAHSEVNSLLAGNKQDDDQPAINKSSGNDCEQLANGGPSEERQVKKKKRKMSKTQEVGENTNMDVEKDNNKPSATEAKGKNENSGSCNKKTLSNGLIIEDLVTGGNSKGEVAAAGRKVKILYVVKLKENGQVIDSNGKSSRKLRLGDKEVIEGLNVGLDGMRVGDRRRLTIPPSMSLGYKGTGENVPPNSWLVYDVEMTSIH